MTRAIFLRIAILACLCMGYSACGQKGDLYLPEQNEADQAANQQ